MLTGEERTSESRSDCSGSLVRACWLDLVVLHCVPSRKFTSAGHSRFQYPFLVSLWMWVIGETLEIYVVRPSLWRLMCFMGFGASFDHVMFMSRIDRSSGI
jgi:hypothetical protein